MGGAQGRGTAAPEGRRGRIVRCKSMLHFICTRGRQSSRRSHTRASMLHEPFALSARAPDTDFRNKNISPGISAQSRSPQSPPPRPTAHRPTSLPAENSDQRKVRQLRTRCAFRARVFSHTAKLFSSRRPASLATLSALKKPLAELTLDGTPRVPKSAYRLREAAKRPYHGDAFIRQHQHGVVHGNQ